MQIMILMKISILITMLALVLSGCAHISPEERTQNAESLAAAGSWEKFYIQTNYFTMAAFAPKHNNFAQTLHVYIEGDGLAWQHRRLPSQDPTPVNPLALKLALKDPQAAVYLARPCQYVQGRKKGCEQRYWTHARFSAEVIEASSQAITVLKDQYQAQKLVLIGYSGGGAVAALVAAQRSDVDRLITVAGNLDHAQWTTFHHVSPLSESLNPVDYWPHLQFIEQLHLVGANDKVIPASISRSFLQHSANTGKHRLRIIEGFDHHCCWVEQWPDLMMPVTPGKQNKQ